MKQIDRLVVNGTPFVLCSFWDDNIASNWEVVDSPALPASVVELITYALLEGYREESYSIGLDSEGDWTWDDFGDCESVYTFVRVES
jgi:hypothetical protein